MRFVAVAVAVVTILLSSRPADACGYWRMADVEKGLEISWLINSASIEKGDRRLAALYLDLDDKHGERTALGKQVIYDIAGDTIRHSGKPIGKLRGDTVAFGDHVYTITLTDPHLEHGARAWALTVTRGDTTVVTSDTASALCSAMQPDDAAKAEDEVRRRVVFYLAWREGR